MRNGERRSKRWRCGEDDASTRRLTTMAWIETSLPRWPGWRHLPRETRDTLFLLAVIGWTVLPHLARLPWWCVRQTSQSLHLRLCPHTSQTRNVS